MLSNRCLRRSAGADLPHRASAADAAGDIGYTSMRDGIFWPKVISGPFHSGARERDDPGAEVNITNTCGRSASGSKLASSFRECCLLPARTIAESESRMSRGRKQRDE